MTRANTEPFGKEKDILIGLKQFGTDTQKVYIDAVIEHGSANKAAKSLGLNESTVRTSINRLKAVAAKKGYAPEQGDHWSKPLPDGFTVKRKSQYDKETTTWTISEPDKEKQAELMRECIEAMKEEIPRVKPQRAPDKGRDDLLNMHVISDAHLGMLAWHREGGKDWDIKIAEETIIKAYAYMIAQSPEASSALIVNLGDFYHTDGIMPVTPTSGHVLDADSRFGKIVRVGVKLRRAMVDMALEKYRNVKFVEVGGNHDYTSSIHSREFMKAMYEKEPRLKVDDSQNPYHCHHFHNNMIGFHHGHKVKPMQLPQMFATQYAEIWGKTKHREVHCGHFHHNMESKQHGGMFVQQHSTLASRDAHASFGGYEGKQRADSVTYHAEYGRILSLPVTPEMVM